MKKIAELEEELAVTRTLNAYGATVRGIDFKRHNYRYYLLHMVPQDMSVSYTGFHEHQLDEATRAYLDLEKKIQEGNYEQVVLVSGVTFQELQRAYPNYFLDS